MSLRYAAIPHRAGRRRRREREPSTVQPGRGHLQSSVLQAQSTLEDLMWTRRQFGVGGGLSLLHRGQGDHPSMSDCAEGIPRSFAIENQDLKPLHLAMG